MDIEFLRNYCLKKKGTSEAFPFDNQTLVFRVMEKMFALTNIDNPVSINLKCDPEYAIKLRESYEAVQPGYHMNKKHWNTVSLVEGLDRELIKELIDHSYELVVKGLKKAQKAELEQL